MAGVDYTPKPGTIGLTRIGGLVGFLVGLGQHLIGDGSRWTHAFVVMDNGMVAEARPDGVGLRPLADYLDGRPLGYVHGIPLDDGQRRAVTAAGRTLLGRRYGWHNYLYLALAHVGLRPRWLQQRIAQSQRMICSQFVDETYRLAGLRLFVDGRLPHDVTPGDLANLPTERDWTVQPWSTR